MNPISFKASRLLSASIMLLCLAACSGTKVVHSWQSEAQLPGPPGKIAAIVMMPEEGLRLVMENELVAEIEAAGGTAVASSKISGMRGNLTKEKAEKALKAAGIDAAVVVFLKGANKGEELQRSDYYLKYEGGYAYSGWFSPEFVDVYSVQEGAGYYDQTRHVFVESTYYQLPSTDARWTIVTESTNLAYRNAAQAIFGKIVSQLKKDGAL